MVFEERAVAGVVGFTGHAGFDAGVVDYHRVFGIGSVGGPGGRSKTVFECVLFVDVFADVDLRSAFKFWSSDVLALFGHDPSMGSGYLWFQGFVSGEVVGG